MKNYKLSFFYLFTLLIIACSEEDPVIEYVIVTETVTETEEIYQTEYKKKIRELNLNEDVAIEFIDPEESDLTMIAISETELPIKINCEYMDIHPSLIFGGLTSSMSFLNHNPCVRATYSHAQSKQSIAIPTTNFNYRFDNTKIY